MKNKTLASYFLTQWPTKKTTDQIYQMLSDHGVVDMGL